MDPILLFYLKFSCARYLFGPKNFDIDFFNRNYDPKIFWTNIFFGPNNCLNQYFFLDPTIVFNLTFFYLTFFGGNIFLSQIFLDTKFFLGPKLFFDAKFLDPYFFGPIFFLTQNFLDTKFFWPKIFLDPKFFGPKIFLDPKVFVKLQSKLNSSVQVGQEVDFVFPLSQQ